MGSLKDPAEIRRIARKSLFEELDGLCEGAVVVDRDARIVWMSDKYAARLGLEHPARALGQVVEDVTSAAPRTPPSPSRRPRCRRRP